MTAKDSKTCKGNRTRHRRRKNAHPSTGLRRVFNPELVLQFARLMAALPVSNSNMQLFQEEYYFLLRSTLTATVFFALLLSLSMPQVSAAYVYDAAGQGQTTKTTGDTKQTPKAEKADPNQKIVTAEQVAESAIFVYGPRQLLEQIRRNGMERGRVCKPTCDVPGKTEEATYERRFVRGENSEKDKVRLDQKMPTIEYSLIYGDGRLSGIINGAVFTPREDTANTFLSQHRHGLDTLLRYKENGSTLSLVGREKQKGLDLYVLNLVDKDKTATRYYISAKTLHILWLEYEEPGGSAGPVKYVRRFFDYRRAQGTLVPYKTVLLEDGKQLQETKILTVTYGIKLDDSLFKAPEA